MLDLLILVTHVTTTSHNALELDISQLRPDFAYAESTSRIERMLSSVAGTGRFR